METPRDDKPEPPGEFALTDPEVALNSSRKIQWNNAEGATSYDFHLTTSGDCDSAAAPTETTEQSTWQGNNIPAGDYQLCVFARNEGGVTAASNQGMTITVRQGWYPISSLGAPSPRRAFTAAMVGGKVMIYGGSEESTPLATGALYDPATDTWSALGSDTSAIGSVGWHTITAVGENQAILWGGWPTNRATYGYRYDHNNKSWQVLNGTGQPAVRFSHSAVWSGKELLTYGGDTSSTDGYQGTSGGFRYDPQDDIWVSYSTGAGVGARMYHNSPANVAFTSANFTMNSRLGSYRYQDGMNNVADKIVLAIDSAERSVYVAHAHFRKEDIYKALLRAHERGVEVRIITDQQEFRGGRLNLGESGRNLYFEEHLAGLGVDVKYKTYALVWDYRTTKQIHTKYLIIDKKWVVTGSYNWSDNAEQGTFENVVSIKRREHVQKYRDHFDMAMGWGGDEAFNAVKEAVQANGGTGPCLFDSMALTGDQIKDLRSLYQRNACR